MTSTPQKNRAAGVLIAQACGDALGVPYEFGVRELPDNEAPKMLGGGLGGFLPGEFSDDTQMALCIAWAGQRHGTLTSSAALDEVASWFLKWYGQHPADVGNQTRAVLTSANALMRQDSTLSPAQACTQAAQKFTETHERSAGNGALMRGGIVGLVGLHHGREVMADVARRIAALTHADPLVLDSCVLLAEMVRVAVLDATLQPLAGLDLIDADRRAQWQDWVDSATGVHPKTIEANGSTFGAYRAAWAAISTTDDGTPGHLKRALELAVRCENDTDTVAAIAGAMLGARYGLSAVPAAWRRAVLGWNGAFPVSADNCLRARDLTTLALTVAGETTVGQWPLIDAVAAPGPSREVSVAFDSGLTLGNQAALATSTADAVVSLCGVGEREAAGPNGRHASDRVETWLIDSDAPTQNEELLEVMLDAADAVYELRSEGKSVLLHCVHMHHRTPSVAYLYAVKHCGLVPEDARQHVMDALEANHIDGLLWDVATGYVGARRKVDIQAEADKADDADDDDDLPAVVVKFAEFGHAGVKQAFAWRAATELVRRHPDFDIYEEHGGGGQYDEIVVVQREPQGSLRSVIRFNYAGGIHVAPFEDDYVRLDWVEALNLEQYEFLRRVEDICAIERPHALPATTDSVLAYRVIAALTASQAFDRYVPSMRNGYCDTAGMGGGVRSQLIARFEGLTGRTHPMPGNPFGEGAYHVWVACYPPEAKHRVDLAFDLSGAHVHKAGRPKDDRFDLTRTYQAVGRQFDVLLAEFDRWRAM